MEIHVGGWQTRGASKKLDTGSWENVGGFI